MSIGMSTKALFPCAISACLRERDRPEDIHFVRAFAVEAGSYSEACTKAEAIARHVYPAADGYFCQSVIVAGPDCVFDPETFRRNDSCP